MSESEVNISPQPTKTESVSPFHTICPILVGVAGGSASGKTTLCNRIISSIGLKDCTVLSLDSFYKGVPKDKAKNYNFDIPDAIDFDACYEVVKQLIIRQEASVPIYSFVTHQREGVTKVVPGDMILLEGILALHDPRIVALMNLKIFVDCDEDIRLYRRLLRDVKERGRDVAGILYQYNTFVKPAFDDYIGPSKKYADIIVPGNNDNTVAINFIVQNLESQLNRLEELKKNINNNFYHIDIIDSCWLNVSDNKHRDLNELALYHSNKILFLRDPISKNECMSIFQLFSTQFSKTLYQLSMVRLVTYGVKMMKRFNPGRSKRSYTAFYYLKDIKEIEENINELDVVGIIVPFLYDETVEGIKQKIDRISEKKKDVQIYIISIFASMDIMTRLSKEKENIFIINILCIVDMRALLKMLETNCKVKTYDFLASEAFINLLLKSSKKEIARSER